MDKTEQVIQDAKDVHARVCAPKELANAEANLVFARLEFRQGYLRRAEEHLDESWLMARAALERARPCAEADRDRDTIADVIDQCPDEPEDFDGVQDEDGCRDIHPYGDEDRDTIRNIDDACIDNPEDFDGHNDEDGCPETSDDTDGDGLIDAVDTCPLEAEDFDKFKDGDGCPDYDNDQDEVPDIRDACRNIPEDRDQWEDDDGCPDPDNDGDGIPDDPDKCPNQAGLREYDGCPETDRDRDGIADDLDRCPDRPETVNGYLDEDGCPDTPPSLVVVTQTQVEITEVIQFAFGRADLLSESYPVLNDVVKVLKDVPDMRLRVEGHTDSKGEDAFNKKLSQDRADSVKTYLVGQGIDRSRLETEGFGESRPIESNRTDAGRAANRRVEFHIIKD